MKLFLSIAALAMGLAVADEIKIDVTRAVDCDRKSKSGDKIEVHYRGTLASDGKEFDASYNRGTPFSFKLGGGQVIKGWDQGLLDMCIGEKRTLTIPPEYGYGQRSMGPIPAGSTLVFETELMGIDGVPKPEKIVEKAKEGASDAASEVSEAAEKATETAEGKAGEKVASIVSEATEAVKTIMVDTDDTQEHNEL